MDDDFDHIVLVNAEGQHAIWPARTPVPAGWSQVGPTGPKALCMEWVDENWTDMTPISQRAAR